MTGDEMRTQTHNILDGDTIEEEFFYKLASIVKDLLEEERPWEYLKKEDSSKSRASGDTFETTKSNPSDWRETLKIFVGDSMIEYLPIPFEERRRYKDTALRYYLDVAGDTFALTGSANASDTIFHIYKKTTDDISASATPSFPSRFHMLIPFGVAGMYREGVDFDDFNSLIAKTNRADARALLLAMRMWDDKLKEKSQKGKRAHVDIDSIPDVIDTNL